MAEPRMPRQRRAVYNLYHLERRQRSPSVVCQERRSKIESWQDSLRLARERQGLSRAELARRASLSVDTVRAYEQGRRSPTNGSLTAILDALKLDRTEANNIRLALGFGTPSIADQFTVPELEVELERLPWPAFAANELMEVVAANQPAQTLWGVDLSQELLEPAERNLLRIASTPRFAGQCLNWDEVVGLMVGMWKSNHRGAESLDEPSPYFEQLIKDFMGGDPKYVKRFLDLWERTEPHQPKVRIHYPVHWRHDDAGEMRFLGIQSSANIWEALGWHDWIPADAQTWTRLNALLER